MPRNLGFEVLTELPKRMYPGLVIEYRVRPIFGVPVTWLTEITHVDEGNYFVDEQRLGPYAIWHHEHFFEDGPDGNTLVKDLVHYRLPFSPLGDWTHGWLVRPRLDSIFAFRKKAIDQQFPPAAAVPPQSCD